MDFAVQLANHAYENTNATGALRVTRNTVEFTRKDDHELTIDIMYGIMERPIAYIAVDRNPEGEPVETYEGDLGNTPLKQLTTLIANWAK